MLYRGLDTLGVPIRLSQNIATAVFCATRTPILLGGKPVVIAEFLAVLNITFGNNPYGTFSYDDVTVGVTGVVDIAGFVLQGLAINIIAVIAFKNVLIPLREAFGGFCLGNSLTNVRNNPCSFFDLLSGKRTFACNT